MKKRTLRLRIPQRILSRIRQNGKPSQVIEDALKKYFQSLRSPKSSKTSMINISLSEVIFEQLQEESSKLDVPMSQIIFYALENPELTFGEIMGIMEATEDHKKGQVSETSLEDF